MNRLRLNVFTIALDAMPWISCIFAELNRLHEIPWEWTIVEGAAMNVKDTRWMSAQPPRLSSDGTTEFLDAISFHPRVRVLRQAKWDGKVEMCNVALDTFSEPGVLLQNDCDELWTADQYRRVVELFEDDNFVISARFDCRYFVGPNVITKDAGNPAEWLRAWRFRPGMRFITHEPPNLEGNIGRSLDRDYTAGLGLVFDHHSWTLPKHVAMKEALYGPRYRGALDGWNRIQANNVWPDRLKKFFPWDDKNVPIDQVFKP